MTRFYSVLAIGLFAALTPAGAAASEEDMQKMLDKLIQRNDGLGGGVVRIAGPSGVLWQGTSGWVAGKGSAPMAAETPFEIASITKAVTATTVMRLIEEGRLTLETRLSEILPERARRFPVDPTIRQLLSHTSGLLHYWEDGPQDREGNNAFLRAFLADPNHYWNSGEILSYAQALPIGKVGKFHYSDSNFVLLGVIIEKLTGKPLAQVYREMIFNPLGMKSTWLTYHEPRVGAVPSHRFEGDEDLNNVKRQSADWAGGGLVSTTRDLERFLRGLAQGKIFRHPETLKQMLDTVPTGDADVYYGLGLYLVRLDKNQGVVWGHDGHGNSFAYYWPEKDITFTGTLNQVENDWWPLVDEFIDGGNPEVVLIQNDDTFDLELSTGWDSLYMDKGINSLGDSTPYGAGIYWTNLSMDYALTESDILSASVWNAIATSGYSYKEWDFNIGYTRLIGDFSLSVGYAFDYGMADGNYFSNELGLDFSYDWTVGPMTFTPSANYTFALGPDADSGTGMVQQGASFLQFRLDGSLPVWGERLALEPWAALGVNFRYNTQGEDAVPFNGINNLEFGLSIPYQINRILSISIYGAYSRALTDLYATEPNTFWGGGSVTFSF